MQLPNRRLINQVDRIADLTAKRAGQQMLDTGADHGYPDVSSQRLAQCIRQLHETFQRPGRGVAGVSPGLPTGLFDARTAGVQHDELTVIGKPGANALTRLASTVQRATCADARTQVQRKRDSLCERLAGRLVSLRTGGQIESPSDAGRPGDIRHDAGYVGTRAGDFGGDLTHRLRDHLETSMMKKPASWQRKHRVSQASTQTAQHLTDRIARHYGVALRVVMGIGKSGASFAIEVGQQIQHLEGIDVPDPAVLTNHFEVEV